MSQEQIHKQKQETTAKVEETKPVEPKNLENKELAEDIDEILAEIDNVLEVNAEEFVAAFVQKGGE